MAAPDAQTSLNSTVVIDCDPQWPQFAASYLLISQGEAAFIDNYTRHAVPKLLSTLKEQGLSAGDVKYVIITHVHLDHAGGTGELMAACPNATLLTHPKGARHMIDPTKLINAVRQVYGDEFYNKTYDPIRPVPAERVRSMEDGESVTLGQRPLRFIHTRGHANHHMCIWDETTREIFTGDSFGVAYPAMQHGAMFIFATTTPTEYDGELARQAIDTIVGLKPKVAYPTHFGPIQDIDTAARLLKEDLFACDEILNSARNCATESEMRKLCHEKVRALFERKVKSTGQKWTEEVEKILTLDMQLNADGLLAQAIWRNSKS
jgi:glyoxylase-like metal-dependent hydrolase (beta-lactamase superfamily II)